jgi:hypothetical protein
MAFERLNQIPIQQIGRVLGMTIGSHGGAPCPQCRAAKRGDHDNRPPVGFGRWTWRCFRGGCGAAGDGISLAAAILVGGQPNGGDREAWRAFGAALAVSPLGEGGGRLPPIHVVEEKQTPAPRPPREELIQLWRMCSPIQNDRVVSSWMGGRAIDAVAVDRMRLARALPQDAGPLPDWARCRGMPWRDGWRLVLPAYSPHGRVASFRARWTDGGAQKMKEVSAAYGPRSAGGMVYCSDPAALARGRGGDPLQVLVVEGGPDFLTAATRVDSGWVIIGIWSGAWNDEFVQRLPDHSHVVLWPHQDESGMRYARSIYRSLKLRNLKISIQGEQNGSE